MIILLPIILPIFLALCILGIHTWRPDFKYHWLIAACTALIMWTTILLLQIIIPLDYQLLSWKPVELFPISPSLLLDDISWSYSLSLVTILLAVILTAVVRIREEGHTKLGIVSAEWSLWAVSLIIVAFGLMATLAGNLTTLIIAWIAMDIIETVLRLANAGNQTESDRIVMAFAVRIMGILLVIWVIATLISANLSTNLNAMSPQISFFLILAAGLRLGVFPVQLPLLKGEKFRRGFGTLLRLVPATASLMVLTRTNPSGMSNQLVMIFLGLAALGALYGGLSWSTASDEIDGQPYWIIALSAFILATSVQSKTTASLAWGIALILSGGVIFLYSLRDRRLSFFPILGLLGITTVPFTAAWYGIDLYSSNMPILLEGTFIFAHALIISGYVLFILRPGDRLSGIERIVWVIYPWGLLLLPLVQYAIAILSIYLSSRIGENPPSLLSSWPGFLACGLAALITYLRLKGQMIPLRYIDNTKNFLSMNWIYGIFGGIYRMLGYIISLINRLVEGRGAILWAILLLTLIISLLTKLEFGK